MSAGLHRIRAQLQTLWLCQPGLALQRQVFDLRPSAKRRNIVKRTRLHFFCPTVFHQASRETLIASVARSLPWN